MCFYSSSFTVKVKICRQKVINLTIIGARDGGGRGSSSSNASSSIDDNTFIRLRVTVTAV